MGPTLKEKMWVTDEIVRRCYNVDDKVKLFTPDVLSVSPKSRTIKAETLVILGFGLDGSSPLKLDLNLEGVKDIYVVSSIIEKLTPKDIKTNIHLFDCNFIDEPDVGRLRSFLYMCPRTFEDYREKRKHCHKIPSTGVVVVNRDNFLEELSSLVKEIKPINLELYLKATKQFYKVRKNRMGRSIKAKEINLVGPIPFNLDSYYTIEGDIFIDNEFRQPLGDVILKGDLRVFGFF